MELLQHSHNILRQMLYIAWYDPWHIKVLVI